MMWLELIKVQAAIGKENFVANELNALKQNVLKNPDCSGLAKIIIYDHASVPGQFAICLGWESESPQTGGSLMGLNLSQALKAFGLVDHSVWIEKERGTKISVVQGGRNVCRNPPVRRGERHNTKD